MADDIKKFKDDKEGKAEAKKWGKVEAETWDKKMSKVEKDTVTDYVTDKKDFKKEYEASTIDPDLKEEKRKAYENLNKGMEKATTSSGVVSYNYTNQVELGSSQAVFSRDKEVKDAALVDFKKQFENKNLLLGQILETSLTAKDTVQNDRILMEITTPSPKGNEFKPNNGVNLSKEEPILLVDSRYKIHVDNVNEINVKGKECIKLTGKVVDNVDFKNNTRAAEKWGNEKWDKWAEELTAEEVRDINNYMNRGYQEINRYLWEGKYDPNKPEVEKNETDKKIENISAALNKGEVPASLTVYRWCGKPEWGYTVSETVDREKFEKDWIGKDRLVEGFNSTSLVSDSVQFESARSILLRLNLSKGAKGGYVGSHKFSQFGGENELILDKGQTIRINRVTEVVVKGKKKLVVDADLIQPK